MIRKFTLILFFVCFSIFQIADAQIIEDFSDGNFTSNPTWIGFTDSFTVSNGQLRSRSGSIALESYLTTGSSETFNSWEFYFRLAFNPSANNFAEFWLRTDNLNITAAQNGILVRIGGPVGDGIGLYKKVNGVETLLVASANTLVNSSNNFGKIKVTLSSSGNWEIFEQISTANYVLIGSATDNFNFASLGLGVWLKATASNRPSFYFDDIRAENTSVADVTPPVLVSGSLFSPNQIELQFSEPVDETFASTASFFNVNPLIAISSSVRLAGDFSKVRLTLASNLSVGVSTIVVNQAKDLVGNIQNNPQQTTVTITAPPSIRSLVINEIYADESPSLGLPLVEYIEILNTTSAPIQLDGDSIQVGNTKVRLPSYVLNANAYLILCRADSVAKFSGFGPTLGISLPTLTNSGATISIKDPNGNVIDAVTYALSWYNSTSKQNGGWSLEQINPKLKCSGKFNWTASNAGIGGTPGTQNSVFSNIPDATAPTLDSLVVVNPNQIRLVFNEILNAEAVPASNFTIAGLTIGSAQTNAPNNRSILINLSTAIQNGITYTLNYSGIKDCEGNIQTASLTRDFIFLPPGSLAPRSLVINEIYADESPSLGLPLVEYIEILNTTNAPIQIGGVKIYVKSTTAANPTLYTLPANVLNGGNNLIVCRNDSVSKFSGFGQTIGAGTFTLSNSDVTVKIIDINGTDIDEVTYSLSWYNSTSKQNGGWSLEQINPKLKCSGKFNWTASNAGIGGTPGTQNSVFSNIPDVTAPTLDSLVVVNPNQIRLVFNEILNAEAVPASNFTIAGLTIGSAQTNAPNNRSILINLSTAIQNGITYTLSYSGIKDCEGNIQTASLTRDFIFLPPGSLAPRSLVINEIYADESPSLGLPLVEYIEILNTTNAPIQIGGVKIYVKSTTAANPTLYTLPAYVLNGGNNLIVCRNDSVSKFSGFGQTIGAGTFTLSNSDVTVKIIDINEADIDEVTYSLSWYNITSKQNGGWSLEQINPKLKCSGKFNWTASNAGIGGTPGTQNSVFSNIPDVTAPTLDSLVVVNPNQIRLVFNEILNAEALPASNFTIAGLTIGNVTNNLPNAKIILLNLTTAIQTGQPYTLTFSGIKDCEGNIGANPQTKDFIFVPPAPVASRALVINEIYADPKNSNGLPNIEYVEILNTSAQPIQLEGIKITTQSESSSTITERILPSYVLAAGNYVAICRGDSASKLASFGPTVGLPASFTLANSDVTIRLFDIIETEIDQVTYSTSWYNNSSKSDGGWSLEQINPKLICSSKFNWSASNASIGGTPGKINSIYSDKPDITAPRLVKIELAGADKVLLVFSEPINPTTPDSNSFQIPGLKVSYIGNRNPDNESITVGFSTPFEIGKTYELTFGNIKDCAGNTISAQILSIGKGRKPEKFDLLITEVQADDTPENTLPKAEYIEIYNNTTDLLDLTGVKIIDESGEGEFPSSFLGPGEYLVVVNNTSLPKFEVLSNIKVLGISPFITLNSEGDNLTLFNSDGLWLHQFHFASSDYAEYSKWTEGWSLELIDVTNPCDELNNWAISTSLRGGTPGIENSVKASKPDLNAPKLVRATVPDSNVIKIRWNELLDSVTLANANISISNDFQVVGKTISPTDFSVLQIKTDKNLVVNQVVTITIGLVKDCAGNETNTETITTVRAGKAEANFWILNEILFDPKTGGSDYVEIKNVSNQYLDLKEVILATDDEEKYVSSETIPIAPGGFALFTDSKALTIRDYPKGKSENFFEIGMPSFNSDSGTVRIIGPEKQEWQKFFYSDKIHAQILDETKGVSLERISSSLPVNEVNSWQSASSGENYGTPGYENSQSAKISESSSGFSVEPKAFSPNGDGNKDFTLFSYNFDKAGLIGNLRIYSPEGLLVKNIAQTALLGKDGFWKWDGSTEQGRKARIGIYVAVLETVQLGGDSKYYKIPVAIASEK